MMRQLFLIAAIAAAALHATDKSPNACDRACLQGFVDSYLDAMAKHDPSTLPVAATVKFTENGKVLKLGEGFWKTAGASSTGFTLWITTAGDASVQAVVSENGATRYILRSTETQSEERLLKQKRWSAARAKPDSSRRKR
jgi:hypothetical protein